MAAHLAAKRRSRRTRMRTRRTLSRSHSTPSDVTHASTAHRAAEEALTLEHISSLTNSADSYDEPPMFEDAPIHHALTFHDADLGEQGRNDTDFAVVTTHVSQINPLHAPIDLWISYGVSGGDLYRSLAVAESLLACLRQQAQSSQRDCQVQ